MRAEELHLFLRDPESLGVESLEGLRGLVEKYPFFQGACALYLKNLKNTQDAAFSGELNRLAICLPDAQRLYILLEGEGLPIVMRGRAMDDKKATDSFSLIDDFLSSREDVGELKATNEELIQPTVSSDYFFWSRAKDEKREAHEDENRLKHQDLIDSFIENEQKGIVGTIRARGELTEEEPLPLPDSMEKERNNKSSLDDSYFTETLARIYIKQKRYEKALQIIKNLSLKYPEKNIYFADQIRFLEKLIINTKK